MNQRIYRWETPGRYDILPYGTEIVRLKSIIHPAAEIYRQNSLDQERPKWESVGMVDGSTAKNSPLSDRGGE